MNKEDMNIRKKKIERVILTGKRDEITKAWIYLDRHDYRVIQSGPIFVKKYKADFSRFKIIGEREIQK